MSGSARRRLSLRVVIIRYTRHAADGERKYAQRYNTPRAELYGFCFIIFLFFVSRARVMDALIGTCFCSTVPFFPLLKR